MIYVDWSIQKWKRILCLQFCSIKFQKIANKYSWEGYKFKSRQESTLFGKVFGFGIKLVSSSCLFWSFSLSNTSVLSTKLITVQWALFWLVCLFFQLFFLFLSLCISLSFMHYPFSFPFLSSSCSQFLSYAQPFAE